MGIAMNRRFIKAVAIIFAATMLMLLMAGCGKSQVIPSGSAWGVKETTKLSSLSIGEGAAI